MVEHPIYDVRAEINVPNLFSRKQNFQADKKKKNE